MILEIGNWTITKADSGKENDKVVPIRLIANKLQTDRENQEMLPQAFSKATVDRFIKYGIIDWHHQSVMGKTNKDRAGAILGKPYDFKWENNLPVVYANLTKSHPIVRDDILPHLEAGQAVFSASVGGNIKKARKVVQGSDIKEQILEVDWDHLAIAGSPYVISPGSEVSLVKAYGSEANDVLIKFSDLSAFENSHDLIYKALEVGSGITDITALTNVGALVPQSLAGYKDLCDKVSIGLKNNHIGSSSEGVRIFLRSEGLSQVEIDTFLKKFTKTINTVLKNWSI